MRKMIVAVTSAALVAGVFSAPWADAGPAKKRKRTVTATYATPALGTAGAGGGECAEQNGVGCVIVMPKSTESFARIAITDRSGRPVFASWGQDYDDDGFTDGGGDFCGVTKGAVGIRPGVELIVFLWNGPGVELNGVNCPGPATAGSVKITLSNRA